jgi:release factor glutamine methyltransferase
MILKELYSYCVEQLAFTEDNSFEALCLFEDILGYTKEQIYLSEIIADDSQVAKINDAVSRRKNGEPLQYILGKWDFYDMTFSVGEGVLIPRPETEMLVDFALEKLKNIPSPVVFDLCSGSGCVGLSVAKHRPDATVFLLEKERNALRYLLKNKVDSGLENVTVIFDDLFTVDLSLFPEADMILSNPPYINSDEIATLQKEVLFEPSTALDGGEDGLMFYRCLANRWRDKVKKNGFMAFECGEEQSKAIIDIFKDKFVESNVIFDFNNIDRIVTFGI